MRYNRSITVSMTTHVIINDMAQVDAIGDFFFSASALSAASVDLSRRGISQLPLDFPGYEKLECLYLEGNQLTSLPDNLFLQCPNLRWLDLRNNNLQSIPPNIDKLRSLRTLLLEGNQVSHLPPQLSHLKHLSGLNLSKNPLQSPPKEVVEKGTKAVLKYLSGLLCEGQECAVDHTSSEDDGPATPTRHKPAALLRKQNKKKRTVVGTSVPSQVTSTAAQMLLPSSKQLVLHCHSPSAPRQGWRDAAASSGRAGPSLSRVGRRPLQNRKLKSFPSDYISSSQKQEIALAIDQQKSQQFLEDWRQETRERQQQQLSVGVARAAYFVPCAGTAASDSVDPHYHRTAQPYTDVHATSSKEKLSQETTNRNIQLYTQQLKEKRRQFGLTELPSKELVQAEMKLAEAMARRKELEEEHRKREYRLCAFTGDD